MAAALDEAYFPPVVSTRQQTINSTTISNSSTLYTANLLNFLYIPLQQSIKNSTTTITAANKKKRKWYLKGTTTIIGRTTFFAKFMYITFFYLKYSTLQQYAYDIVKIRMCRQIIERIMITLFSLKTRDTKRTKAVYWDIMYRTLSRNLATCISTFSLNLSMQVGPSGFSGSGWKCQKITSPFCSSCSYFFSSCFLRCTATRQITINSTIATIVKIAISKIFCPISVCFRNVFSLQYLLVMNVQSDDLYPAPMMFQIMRYCMAQSRYPKGLTHAISTRLYSPKV